MRSASLSWGGLNDFARQLDGMMRLSEQQHRFYESFGFLGFPRLFADEADAITESFEKIWAHHGGGHHGQMHDHEQRSAIMPFLDEDEFLCSLIDDPRIEGPIAALLGEDFNYAGSDGNLYVGETNWHSDGGLKKLYPSIKIAFYLDPVGADSGCLRVIPGSHHQDDTYANLVHEAAPQYFADNTEAFLGVTGRDIPAFPLVSEPGDVLLFNRSIKHASYGGGTRRRMFTINFEHRYAEEHLESLRERISSNSRFWATRSYGETMIRTAGPNRMRHLEQRLANDGHLADLTAKAREEMDEPSRA